MDYFFYGTLMDDDVLRRVLDWHVPEHKIEPAVIVGYGRYRADGGSYPVLVAEPGGRVEGRLVGGLDQRDAARLERYESNEFVARSVVVTGARRGPVTATVFMIPAARASSERWELEAWQRRDKPRFLTRIAGWVDGA